MQITDQQDNKYPKPCNGLRGQASLLQVGVVLVGARLAREEARKADKSAQAKPAAIHWCAKASRNARSQSVVNIAIGALKSIAGKPAPTGVA
ncbi:hypothetical protein J2Y74_000548 [Pseudomonas migulae]|uniref:hypothetical protein n=1 Tax=Pseudomonas migulae TaxID=78543 RepID=UPI00209DCA5C|nr:hypothetical protein [Pseudomonas migulae]MCP1516238.1 hypothetical protein [Pseudomonas migulae]